MSTPTPAPRPDRSPAGPSLVERMRPFTSTVFAEMTALALATGSVNLGQGFPDTDGPHEVLDAAVEAIRAGANQYPPGPGTPVLREAVAAHQRRFWGLDVDADDVLVTTGATEALAACVMALAGPGDEVVVVEPYFDSYAAVVALAGAQRRTVVLRPETGFALERDALAAAFTDRTRVVLLNSPHNPTGRVLTREELGAVAELAQAHGAVVVSDEVYDHQTYDPARPHVPIATLPGMAERTLTVGSAGKTFSVTGWKVGWVHGPRDLVAAVRTVKQYLTFVSGAPFQPAVAVGLGLPDDVFAAMAATLRAKRDLLCEGLAAAGLEVHVPGGTFFATADVGALGWGDSIAFCRELPRRAGVVAVPVRVLMDDAAAAPTLVRFAFCKRDAVLHEAIGRLAGADLGAR